MSRDTARAGCRYAARRCTVLACCLFVAAVHGTAPARAQQSTRPEFQPRRVVQPFPPITAAPAIPADEVFDQVADEELVLGVVVGGQARAYPINMLTGPSREIINDTLGGKAIAATW